MSWNNKKVGLALGGGGARGLAHIGVLSVLEEEDIGVDIIAGTSVGAIIGGAYACGVTPRELKRMVVRYLKSPEFQSSIIHTLSPTDDVTDSRFAQLISGYLKSRYHMIRTFFKPGAVPLQDFQSMINYFIPERKIQDTRIPFRAVSTDLISGEQIVFAEGSLREAVLASCAVPGAIDPLKSGDRLLSDGGITSLVPVNALWEAGADMVIAVTVERNMLFNGNIKKAKDVVTRAGEITAYRLKDYELEKADVVIRPRTRDSHWADFSKASELIRDGEDAAREALSEIRKRLPLSIRVKKFLGRFKMNQR